MIIARRGGKQEIIMSGYFESAYDYERYQQSLRDFGWTLSPSEEEWRSA